MQNLDEITGVLSQAQAGVKAQAEAEGWIEQLYHAIAAPLIVWPGFENDFKDKKADVTIARMAKLLKKDFTERATDLEIALYMSTASLGAGGPLDRDASDVYMYAFRHSGYGQTMDQDDMLKDEGNKLDASAQQLYDHLASWIYKKQKQALKEKAQ